MPVSQGPAGVKQEMHKFKEGTLHSGSKTGPIVTNRKQAIAIALKESGQSKNVSFSGPGQRKPGVKSMRSGGMVHKTGKYKLHEDEMVLPPHMGRKIGQMVMQHLMQKQFKQSATPGGTVKNPVTMPVT